MKLALLTKPQKDDKIFFSVVEYDDYLKKLVDWKIAGIEILTEEEWAQHFKWIRGHELIHKLTRVSYPNWVMGAALREGFTNVMALNAFSKAHA